MRTFTSKNTKSNVFANSQDRVVVSRCRETWLGAALHLMARPARLATRCGCAIKRAALGAAGALEMYAERMRGLLSGPRLCPQPVRRQSPASTSE